MHRPAYTTRGGWAALVAVLLAAGFVSLAAGEARAQQSLRRTVEETVPVPTGGRLTVEGDAGSVRVSGSGGRSVRIRAVMEVPGPASPERSALLDRIRMDVTRQPDAVTVRTDRSGLRDLLPAPGGGRTTPRINYTITVPRDVRVEIRTGAGAITVSGMRAEVRLESTGGDLAARGTAGPVIAGTVNGSITVEDAGSGVDVDTVSGEIRLVRVHGRIRATCISGNIVISDSNAGEVRASNTGGDISFEGAVSPGGSYVLSSHSGNIQFTVTGETGFEARLSTFSGSISVPLEFTLTGARTSRRSLRGVYLAPEASVTLTAFSGNITISRR